ncbi:hypothetical protein ACFVAJ_16935 [Agromyces sp. NPDC057679]|uniref:hypothetical protein n=1 Tax=Agromyces sp. NPDC057679 TaxID=3346207 RepID=UPI0036729CCB
MSHLERGRSMLATDLTEPRAVTLRDFWLVQPVEIRTEPSERHEGFDRIFRLPYVGSSEFEAGGQNKSLRRLRDAGDVTIVERHVTHDGTTATVFVVTSAALQESAFAAMQSWVDDQLYAKELHWFGQAIADELPEWHDDLVAWWAFTGDIFWTLDRSTAETLANTITGQEPR